MVFSCTLLFFFFFVPVFSTLKKNQLSASINAFNFNKIIPTFNYIEVKISVLSKLLSATDDHYFSLCNSLLTKDLTCINLPI